MNITVLVFRRPLQLIKYTIYTCLLALYIVLLTKSYIDLIDNVNFLYYLCGFCAVGLHDI
jgi:hypothetical protein